MAFCPECGTVISAEAISCPKCGKPLKKAVSMASTSDKTAEILDRAMLGRPATSKDKTTAALFALFLGGVGAHKFYLGEAGKGVIFLLFCWTFIPTICGFIDFISLLSMSDEKFNRTY